MSIVTWFTIVINDRRPADQHRFMVIALRWMARVGAFQSLLTNARPPLVWQ